MPFKLRLLLFYLNYFSKPIDYAKCTAQDVRKINQAELKKVWNLIAYPPLPMHEVTDQKISMRDGAEIPIRIYKPNDRTDLPIMVFYHGGGFVTRNIESHDRVCRRLAHTAEVMVVSVGYRLAPEFKFPIPHQDCYDATAWVAENGHDLGGDPSQLIVAGDSAGGNLATVVAKLARDNSGPQIAYQLLIYPTTDARLNHPSIIKFGRGYMLTKIMIDWFVDHYKRTDEDKLNPLMSPLLESDLSNLPPAYVLTAEFDPLKDEGVAYAKRLEEAGVETVYKDYKGAIHGFANMDRVAPMALTMYEDFKNNLQQVLAVKTV